ncbi:MAG: glycosyltransferase [Alphaproteobacteria bacterium]
MAETSREPDPIALFIPVFGDNGVARVTANLAETFAAGGHAVDLVIGEVRDAAAHLLPSSARLVRIEDRSVPAGWAQAMAADPGGIGSLFAAGIFSGKPGRRVRFVPGFAAYLRTARPPIVLSAGTNANLVALWARRRAGVPLRLVISEHNALSGKTRGRSRWPAMSAASAGRLVGRAYRRADAVIAVSRGVADDLAATAGLVRRDIATIYNPVVSEDIGRKAAALDHPWFGPGAPPVVLAVAKLHPAKDLATLLRAFARLRQRRNARLMVLGEGSERSSLEAQVADLDCGADVSLPGYCDNPFCYMARAAVLALSSAWEGLPTVLVEAMACGCPVVSTDCPSGPAEILDNGAFGALVPVGDDAALAQAIETVIDHPPAPADLRARAAAFSVETNAARYLEVLRGGR